MRTKSHYRLPIASVLAAVCLSALPGAGLAKKVSADDIDINLLTLKANEPANIGSRASKATAGPKNPDMKRYGKRRLSDLQEPGDEDAPLRESIYKSEWIER